MIVTSTVFPFCTALADFQSGNTLYGICQNNNEIDTRYYDCLGYTSGIADTLLSNTIDGWRVCLNPEVTRRQVKDVVTQFLVTHPEFRHLAASSLVEHALSNAFPCK